MSINTSGRLVILLLVGYAAVLGQYFLDLDYVFMFAIFVVPYAIFYAAAWIIIFSIDLAEIVPKRFGGTRQ